MGLGLGLQRGRSDRLVLRDPLDEGFGPGLVLRLALRRRHSFGQTASSRRSSSGFTRLAPSSRSSTSSPCSSLRSISTSAMSLARVAIREHHVVGANVGLPEQLGGERALGGIAQDAGDRDSARTARRLLPAA